MVVLQRQVETELQDKDLAVVGTVDLLVVHFLAVAEVVLVRQGQMAFLIVLLEMVATDSLTYYEMELLKQEQVVAEEECISLAEHLELAELVVAEMVHLKQELQQQELQTLVEGLVAQEAEELAILVALAS
jgi:hypothetical protein